MNPSRSYQLRLQRKKWQLRARRKNRELKLVQLGDGAADPNGIFLFSTLRNERHRLPYFLDYYRNLGITHFFLVDNDSSDESLKYLKAQPDLSLWHTSASYSKSRFGVDWMNWLLTKYGRNHWCLTVDCDEFLVYPHVDDRPIRALTDWLDACSATAFPAMLLDMYQGENRQEAVYDEGQNPLDVLTHFDSGNYMQSLDSGIGNLWIQGGPRQRAFFADAPRTSPALNKIPLVKWRWGYTYVSSTHMLLPRGLNLTYDREGGEKISGCLLHTKFLPDFQVRAIEEQSRGEHYSQGREYRAYRDNADQHENLYTPQSTRYTGWQQLENLGLISLGGWA